MEFKRNGQAGIQGEEGDDFVDVQSVTVLIESLTRKGFQAIGIDRVRGGVKSDGGALVGGTDLSEFLEERLAA